MLPTPTMRPHLNPDCACKGCTNKAAHRLGCRAWPEGHTDRSPSINAEFWSGLGVCNEHVEWAHANPWFSLGWPIIVANFKRLGRVAPALNTAITVTELV